MPASSKLRLLAGAALCVGGFALPAMAADSSSSELAQNTSDADVSNEPDPILVVGQQNKPIDIVPRGLAVSLGPEQFAAVNAMNVEDLMKYAPNFFVRKRYAGDSNGVAGFRGTSSTQSARTLVMVDGFVVSNFLGNSFSFSPKWGVIGPGEVSQFDIVYGPYSARYGGNAMGGIVNISTRAPERNEAFFTAQGIRQHYHQYDTQKHYRGGSAEGGIGWRQKQRPFSARLSGRWFKNRGQPMSWYGLTPAKGSAPGTAVTGAVIDDGQNIPGAPGTAQNPIFGAQSTAAITQSQVKLRVDYDGSWLHAEGLFAYWGNVDRQYRPTTYLRDANGQPVYEGRVTFNGKNWDAKNANWSRTRRKEYLAGVKARAQIGAWQAKLNLSTYQIPTANVFTSKGYAMGASNGAGTLARQGPTGWYTGTLTIDRKWTGYALAGGVEANLYKTDQKRFDTPHWRSMSGRSFTTRTFGRTRTVSAWIEGQKFFGDRASLTVGARIDGWRAFRGGIGQLDAAKQPVLNHYPSRGRTAVSPAVSGQVRLGPDTDLQLSLAMATRFPTVGELFQGSLNGDGSFNINSFDPRLKPERSRDANLLLRQTVGRARLTGSLFYQHVKNTIFSFTGFNQYGVTTSSFKNIRRERQYGVELIGELPDLLVNGLDLEANLAWTDAKTLSNPALPESDGKSFPRIPRWRINGSARYAFTAHLNGAVGVRYASRPNTDLAGTQRGDTFGYTSELFALDLKLNWDVTRRLRLSAGVDNVTNNRAWVYHPYPQRTLLIELGWKL